MGNILSKNIKKNSVYAQGGITLLLAFTTYQANGLTPSATYTQSVVPGQEHIVTGVAIAVDVKAHVLEFDEDKASFGQNLVVGNNRYIKQQVGMTFSGTSGDKNEIMKSFDLGKHTFACKTRMGKYMLLGRENGLVSEKNDSGSGSAPGDLNGYDLIVSGAENGHAQELTQEAWDALVAALGPDA